MKLIKSTAIIASLTMLSRVLGLVRDSLAAHFLGAGPINDALVTAFKVPNTFRRIFAEGAFNAAFIPLYSREIEEGGEDEANTFASETLAALFVMVTALVIVFEMTMPWTMNLFGAGLSREALTPPNGLSEFAHFAAALSPYDLAVVGAQITMPYLLLLSLTAMFSGILNTRSYFIAAAFAPVLLNVCLVFLYYFTSQYGWDKAQLNLYLCVGMTVSGVLQLGLVYWACVRSGVRVRLHRPRLTPRVKRLFVLGVPGTIAAGITHINIMVSHNISTLQSGAPSWMNYADRLYQLPLGMIGIAMGIALLPALSRSVRAGDEVGAKTSLNRAMEISAFLTLPAAVALWVMPDFLVAGLFERGAFSVFDTDQTASALRMFAWGLPAFILIKVLTPAFFARENTKTPMKYAAGSAMINLVLGVILFFQIGFVGLAIATSIAAWVNVFFLGRALLRNGNFAPDKRLLSRLPRIGLASAIMGVGTAYLAKALRPMMSDGVFGHGIVQNYVTLLLAAALGFLLYLIMALLLRGVRFSDIRSSLKR